jgi:Zn-dependent membrane protease YugP
MVVLSILTLPLEIRASRRALVMLREGGMLNGPEDASSARSVLIAAALTYVAAAVTSILTLLHYISIARR